jgi:hypothetical protein
MRGGKPLPFSKSASEVIQHMDLKAFKAWSEKGFAQIIISAIMAFMVVAILIVVMLPVLSGILNATPLIAANTTLNSTQTQLTNVIGSSLGLLIITLLLIAVLAIIIVIGLFQYFVGGMGGRQ